MYRKPETLIPYPQYQYLWEAGLLDREICQSLPEGSEESLRTATNREKKKRVPVYILEFQFGVPTASAAVQRVLENYLATESEGGSGSES